MKKILVVSATPRRGGNSEIVAETVAAELKEHDVTLFRLREHDCRPCIACGACKRSASTMCAQRDDFTALLPLLDACDALLLASPVYYHQVCAQAKMFIDRFYALFDFSQEGWTRSIRRGKRAALALTFAAGPADIYREYAESTATRSFGTIGASEIRSEVFGGLMDTGEILSNEAYLERVRDLARWLGA